MYLDQSLPLSYFPSYIIILSFNPNTISYDSEYLIDFCSVARVLYTTVGNILLQSSYIFVLKTALTTGFMFRNSLTYYYAIALCIIWSYKCFPYFVVCAKVFKTKNGKLFRIVLWRQYSAMVPWFLRFRILINVRFKLSDYHLDLVLYWRPLILYFYRLCSFSILSIFHTPVIYEIPKLLFLFYVGKFHYTRCIRAHPWSVLSSRILNMSLLLSHFLGSLSWLAVPLYISLMS